MEYVFTYETKGGYHIETFVRYFECMPLAMDFAKCKIGSKADNGSVIGKVRIAGEDEEPIIVVEK